MDPPLARGMIIKLCEFCAKVASERRYQWSVVRGECSYYYADTGPAGGGG